MRARWVRNGCLHHRGCEQALRFEYDTAVFTADSGADLRTKDRRLLRVLACTMKVHHRLFHYQAGTYVTANLIWRGPVFADKHILSNRSRGPYLVPALQGLQVRDPPPHFAAQRCLHYYFEVYRRRYS